MDFLLALIQGICEIYPVSSAGHVVVFGAITGQTISFEKVLFLHLGSALAIAIFYRREIGSILTGRLGWRLPGMMLVSLGLTGAIGLFFEPYASRLSAQPLVVTRLWLLNAALLSFFAIAARPGERDITDLRLSDFILLGIVQGFGALPGISRLGITLGVAVLCKMKWSQGMTVSFLLGLPVIILANLWRSFMPFTVALTNNLIPPTGLIQMSALSFAPWQLIPSLMLTAITFCASWFALFHLRRAIYLGRRLLGFFAVYCLVGGAFFPEFLRLF